MDYFFLLNSASDDVALFVYSDFTFSQLVCSSTSRSSVEQCNVYTGLLSDNVFNVKVTHAGIGNGATFNLIVDREELLLTIDNNPAQVFVDDSAAINLSANYDQIVFLVRTNIMLATFFDPASNTFQEQLNLSVFGCTVGTYNISNEASACYRSIYNGTSADDGNFASGSIRINSIGPDNFIITGSYDIYLGKENLDCSVAMN